MRFLISGLCVCLVINVSSGFGADDKAGKQTDLSTAVKAFNEKAAKDEVGKNEAPLTEDEVAASIRLWDRKAMPISDTGYNAFQQIADTKQLPANAKLSSCNSMGTFNGYNFVVWWVDILIENPDGTGYSYRIRDRRISSKWVGNAGTHLEGRVFIPPK